MFDVAPFVCVHSVAAMHRQYTEFAPSHEDVDVTKVLYHRPSGLPPHMHPGGQTEYGYSIASTSSKPMLVAAASHAALSNIGFRLLSDPQFVLPASLV